MPTPLNYFSLPEYPDPEHENHLTGAFLALLRLVPAAHDEMLALVRKKQTDLTGDSSWHLPRIAELEEEPRVQTQRGDFDEEREWGISVIITDDELDYEEPVQERGSRAVYDGVLEYDSHVLILENKPDHRHFRKKQAHPDVPPDAQIDFPGTPIFLEWDQMLRRLWALEERDVIGPTGARLIDSFREYVEEAFPALNPNDEFGVCGQNPKRLGRRCRQILGEIHTPEEVQSHGVAYHYLQLGGSPVARRLYLRPHPRDDLAQYIRMSVHPADTVTQARRLYDDGRLDLEGLQTLDAKPNWRIQPNLHLSHIQQHLLYPERPGSISEYVLFWREHSDWIGEVSGNRAMKERAEQLREHDLMSEADYREFVAEFVETDRNHMRVSPGINIRYLWPLEEAADLDSVEGQFAENYKDKANTALSLWGESLKTVLE